MSIGTPVGGCSGLLHVVASYPKVAACAAILGLGVGVNVLTPDQEAKCDKAIAQCQGTAQPPVTPPPAAKPQSTPPPEAVAMPVPSPPLPQAVVLDMCAGAPIITDADLFKVVGPVHVWRRAAVDPVRGKPSEPFLRILGYTAEERTVFLKKIADHDYSRTLLKKGSSVGRSTSGNGTYHDAVVVGWNPLENMGTNYKNDARMNVYTYTHKAIYNGDCVERTVTLLEPLVCQNWSRVSDVLRIVQSAADRQKAPAKK